MKKLLTALWIITVLLPEVHAQTCKEVVGYYCNWQWYDRNRLVNPMTIDYSKYSIINYAFFNPQSNGNIVNFDSWADDNLLKGPMNWSTNQPDFTQSLPYRAHLNNVKLLPSIGGWTLSNNFPGIAADPVKRANFAKSCVSLIRTYDFDGVDIDWEYPGYVDHGGTPADKANYVLLLRQVRDSLNAYQQVTGKYYMITAALPAGPSNMVNIDWAALANILDIFNIMTYDFYGSWDSYANHNSPLYTPVQGNANLSCHAAIQTIINTYGVPRNKITMGIPFYGRAVKTQGTPALFGSIYNQPDNITFPEDDGSPLYYNILPRMNLFSRQWDNTAKVPYLLGNGSLNTFVSYDDTTSVALKAQYIVNNNLRGAIVWEISGDVIETFPGSGVIASTPLASAMNNALCGGNVSTCFAPTGLTSSSITSTGAALGWSSTGATSYNIQYKLGSATTWTTVSSTTNSYNLSGLTACSGYQFQVQSVCSGTTTSSYSTAASFQTTGCCTVPAALAATSVTSSGTVLTWSSTGATSYNVQYKLSTAAGWTTVSAPANSYTLSGLTACSTYQFQVQSVCSNTSSSAYSAAVSFQTTCTACSTPDQLSSVLNSSTSATVSWSNTGAGSYRLQYRRAGTTAWTIINTTNTSQLLTGLLACNNFEWQIASVCGSTVSAFSYIASFSTSGCTNTCATVPSNLQATNLGSTSVTLTWTSVGTGTYRVQYRLQSTTSWTSKTVTTNSLSVTRLTACRDYVWRVRRECTSSNVSQYSNTSIFKTTGCTVTGCSTPATPTASNISSSSAVIAWNNTGALSYKLEYKLSSAAIWTSVTVPSNSYLLSGLTACSGYNVRVSSVCSASTSAASSTASFNTTGCCQVPTGVAVTNTGNDSATVSWISSGASAYNIRFKKTTETTWTSLSSSSTSIRLTGLAYCTDYSVQVQSACGNSNSSFSSDVFFKTTGCTTVVNNCSAPSTFYFNSASYQPLGEIKLGQGRLNPVWGVSADAYIPSNKKNWAISMVHAAHLFKNVTGTSKIPVDFYFATAVKESFCGCDNSIQAMPSGTMYPLSYQSASVGDGCFQIESNSAYNELVQDYPQRFPAGQHGSLISGFNYETSALAKAYYDIFTVKYWSVAKGWNPIDFFNNAADPDAALKLMSIAYNRGLWYTPLSTVLNSDRANAIQDTDISNYFTDNVYGYDYQKALTDYVHVLQNEAYKLSSSQVAVNPQSGQPYNYFGNYYDPQISWQDVNNYIDSIMILYPGIDFSVIRSGVQTVFNSINGGASVSFRYQFGQVLDKLILSLPADDPTNAISLNYGCSSGSGGSTCAAPGNLSTAQVTKNSATLSWTGSSSSYNVQYRKQGTITWNTSPTSTTQITLQALDSCTIYEYSVQSVCSTSVSSYSSGSFTTSGNCTATCAIPGGLSVVPSTNSATISWSSTGALSYSLQYRLQSTATWTTINNVSSTSYVLTGLSSCSSYIVKVMSVCSNSSSAYGSETSFTTTGCSSGGGAPTNYCSSYSLNATAEYIQSFRVSNLNNVSGNNNGFGNFINMTANLVAGRSDTLRFAAGFTGTAYTEYWTIRIDFNRDGDFADAGETVAQTTSAGTTVNTVIFTTPSAASIGQARMRVQMKRGAYAMECDIYSNGEVEDYLVNIGSQSSRTVPAEDFSLYRIYPNPTDDRLYLDFGSQAIRKILVFDPAGREMISQNYGGRLLEMDLSSHPAGIYLVRIVEGNRTEVKRIVKR